MGIAVPISQDCLGSRWENEIIEKILSIVYVLALNLSIESVLDS